MTPADAFEPLRSALERAKIRFAIGGSWASTAFGEPRFTNDVDIVAEFTEENIDRFLKSLPETCYSEVNEALFLTHTGLSKAPAPFVTAEDILLAKLHWFRLGGKTSEVQWRDIRRIVHACAATLDRTYLQQGAAKLDVHKLPEKALGGA